jgi:hypothetical protein
VFTGISSQLLTIGSVLILIGGASCAPAEPATKGPPPTVAATSTPLPAPSPTQLLESPTPIPTANFTLADIVGTWTRSDPDRGLLFLIFDENGNYLASHGEPKSVVHAGDFSLEGRLFTFLSGWDCSPAEHTPGKYILRMAGGGKYLLFEPLEDTCPDRPSVFRSLRWDRLEPTPVP